MRNGALVPRQLWMTISVVCSGLNQEARGQVRKLQKKNDRRGCLNLDKSSDLLNGDKETEFILRETN